MTLYTSIKIPKRLAELVQECYLYKLLGFTSVSSFVLWATRNSYLEMIKKK